MAWHVYEIPPIDFGWRHLKTVEETARQLGAEAGAMAITGASGDDPDLQAFCDRWDLAQDLARSEGWDGNHRNAPVVFWVPGDTEFECGFVIKQDTNGTTYVVSPVELHHLDHH